VLVEFAVVLPLLLTLLIGTVDFGLIIREHQIVQNAAREGARFSCMLAYSGQTAAIQNIVVHYMAQEGITITAANVTVSQSEILDFTGGMTAVGSRITVSYSRSLLVANGWQFGPLTMKGEAVSRNFY